MVVEHVRPHEPQFAVSVEVAVSHPLVSAPEVSQFANPLEHPEYVHFEALHVAPVLLVVSQTLPQPPQFVVVVIDVSHPLVFAPALSQSPKPALQTYPQAPAVHVALDAFVVSQVLPQPPQFSVVVVDVSHPLVSGAVALQFAKPGLHEEYAHVVPLQVGPTLFVVSHTLPQPPQLVTDDVEVSQPLVFAPDLSQSRNPALHE